MYCRQCHYDLRALTTPRCPECGKAFDPNNPDTFYPVFPSIGWRAGIALQSGWRSAVFLASCLTWFSIIILPSLETARGTRFRMQREHQLSQANLTSIMTHWINRQEREPLSSNTAFDKQGAFKDLSSGLSPWTEQDLIQHRRQIQYSLRAGQFWVALFVPPFILIALLWRGNVRRAASVFAIVLLFVCLPSFFPNQFSALLVPGTHAFLDDYVYIQNVDFGNPTGKIAAYDWRGPPQGWPNVVAFDDGRVEFLIDDDRAKALFEQQGLAYPEPKKREKEED